jgi:penicillin amidase
MPAITHADLEAALPDMKSTFTFPSLKAPVTIYRDRWGIPHIRAETEHDLFFAQGFATAQDRLFHMDYDRMRCQGRWAEYAGPRALQQDRLLRRRRLDRIAKADYALCSPGAKAMVDAYTAGVNAFMQSTKSWPVEYRLLGTKPEPWEPWHCILAYKVRNTAEGNFHMKVWLARLTAEVGPERAAAITPGYLPGMLLTVPPGAEYHGPVENAVRELAAAAAHMGHFPSPDGESNGWAVSGDRTVSGKPLVAGDSHRQFDTPNVYYQTHLSCPTFSAIGHAVPGFPGVLHFMHNEHVAWGMTHGMGDVQDLFVEQFRESGGQREYLDKGEWRKSEVTTATLNVRGGKPETVEITETRHGPVIAGDPAKGWGITLMDPGSASATKWVDAAYDAMHARSADDFEKALGEWTDRTNNYPYADVHGNFGYVLRGRIPVRTRANGWGPVPGWTGEHEWQGMVPPKDLPRTRNPREGWVVTCNQKTVDETYPYHISNSWAPEYRARRIAARIAEASAANRRMTVADMASIHADRTSLPGRVFARVVRGLDVKGAAVVRARDLLAAWDGDMNRSRPEPLIYSALFSETLGVLARYHYGNLADAALRVDGSGGMEHARRFLAPLMVDRVAKNDSSILPPGKTWPEVLAGALERAVIALHKKHGTDMSKWSWGAEHRTAHSHPLGATFPEAAGLLTPPRVVTHGNGDTPNNGTHGSSFTHMAGPVNRYIFDPSDWRNSRWIVPLGASGHPGSTHFADQQKLWAEVETIPMLWDFRDIEREAETAQRLIPE